MKDEIIKFRVDKEQKKRIEEKSILANKASVSEYIRDIAMYGYIIKFNSAELTELKKQMQIISNNINQIAKRVNVTNHFYDEDINEIRQGVNELWQSLNLVQSTLHSISQ